MTNHIFLPLLRPGVSATRRTNGGAAVAAATAVDAAADDAVRRHHAVVVSVFGPAANHQHPLAVRQFRTVAAT